MKFNKDKNEVHLTCNEYKQLLNNSKYIELLKEFSDFIDMKLYANPSSSDYINWRHKLDQYGINKEELE